MKKKTHEEFMKEVEQSNNQVIICGTYINCSTKIEVECKKCHYTWFAWPESILKGHGCPVCANNMKKTHDSFVHEMHRYNPYIEIVGKYQTALTPLKVRCRICGNEWMAKPNRLLAGAQCMNCVKPHTSFMEQFILLTFQHVLGSEKVYSRDTKAIGVELDIYIPSAKMAIEPGSWLYHEKKASSSDLNKREKCAAKGIRLITIYDTYPHNQEPPFDKDCYVFEGFLNEPGYKRLIELTMIILSDMGYNRIECDWDELAAKAYESCHYNSNETFKQNLSAIAPDIELLEEYKGSNIPILVRNKACGHPAWKARPCTLLKGIGCPICGRDQAAKTRVRTQDQFVEELNAIHPNIIILSNYTTVDKRVMVRCNICGHEWSPLAYSLLSGKGCPHCSAIEGAKKRSGRLATISNDQFKEKVAAISPTIQILGEYKNNKTKVLAKCLICGHEWNVVPASLLSGHGCPKCARNNKIKK